METKIANVEFKNPILVASGCFSNGREFADYIDLSKLGGICTTGMTLNPKTGNPGIRIHETPSGLMNSIGLQNSGIEDFLGKDLDFLMAQNTNIIANLSGNTEEDYVEGAKLLDQSPVHMIELNISCPNVKEGGMAFGMVCHSAGDITRKVRKATTKPLMVKLSPNAHNLVEVAQYCQDAGADALSLVNTFNALAIDIKKRRPVFENITAGLSGPAIKPIALRMVWEVAKAVNIPVVGIGGIRNYEDVVEYIMAGAQAVQIGSQNLVSPTSTMQILEDLENYMKEENIQSLDQIRGII